MPDSNSITAMTTRIKICCIQSIREAKQAIDAGADAIGLVASMPSGPGPIADKKIQEVARAVPGAMSVLLSSRISFEALHEHVALCRPGALQLVDRVDPDTRSRLKETFPGLTVIQVVHVKKGIFSEALDEAVPHSDMLLLDSGNPDAIENRELGGTGRVHDWSESARIIQHSPIPVWLAGGLTPGNVGRAIRMTQPYGVDICSGLRPTGALDSELLASFVNAVRGNP